MSNPGPSYLKVWFKDGEFMLFSPDEEGKVNRDVQAYIETGNDAVLTLKGVDGDLIRTRVSEITKWFLSTPSGRRAYAEFDISLDTEWNEYKEELATPDWL